MTFFLRPLTAPLFAAALTLTLSACDNSDENANEETGFMDGPGESAGDLFSEGPYKEKEGMVKFIIDGGMQKGSKTVYWRKYGLEEATYEDTEISPMPGFSQKTSTWTIRTPETMVIIDRLTNSAKTMNNPTKSMFGKMSRKDMEKMADQMGQSFQRTEVGTQEVAGETCTLYTMQIGPGMEAKTCEWQGLILSNSVMGRNETAIEIDTSSNVDDKHFTMPENLNVEQMPDIDEIMKNLGQGMPPQGQQ